MLAGTVPKSVSPSIEVTQEKAEIGKEVKFGIKV